MTGVTLINLPFNIRDRVTREGDCLVWNGAVLKTGYGAVRVKGKLWRVHRFTFAEHHGREPEGMLLHSCDNKLCVNPLHLSEGSHADNMREARERGQHKRGQDRYNSILNEEAVKVLRYFKAKGYTYKRLGEAYGISQWTVRSAVSGRAWYHVEELQWQA